MDNTALWYLNLIKPSFAPPAYLFGIVWSILYPIIIGSFAYTAYLIYKKLIPKTALTPMFLNIVSNLLFSYIQFGLQNNYFALIDILVVLTTIIWFMKATHKHNKTVTLLQIPYLIWVTFATVLQVSITWLNR
jgi:tryptophan-rich sensory protein